MTKRWWIVLGIGVVMAGNAAAQACPCAGGNRLNQGQISSLLAGNTVCAVLGSDRWQEWHNGASFFELGENFATPDLAGTWSVVGTGSNATVSYAYAGGSTWAYNVCQDGANVHFCTATAGGRNVTNATVRAGKASCGF
ncbi:MAG: hypothetical protein IPM99_20055 [Rubrivivax sp.]|nr:hypothetical protein [Rubrivivax sp.]